MEKDRKASRGDVDRYDLEILLRRPSLRTSIPRRVSQICRDETGTEETNCGVGCIRGQWLQSFANRNSFTIIYGILGSFYGSYYAYFYGVISTLERRFQISSQATGLIAATGDIAQVIMCLILSQREPKFHKPKWIGVGVLLIVTSAVIFTLPHFLYEPYEPKNMSIRRHSTHLKNETVGLCTEEFDSCGRNLEERNGPLILLILAQTVHGIGGSLYFIAGRSYQDENIEKYKPPGLLSFLSVLKTLGPAFGYWLSSISLKIPEYPGLTPGVTEDEPRWIGAWWLGSPVIGFVLIVPGVLVMFFPTTLPKVAVKRTHIQLQETAETRINVAESKCKMSAIKKLFINPNITCTHFAATFNILGFMAYFIFLPKYVETQYRISASNASLIAGSVTLISSAVGIVIANSIITRYRPSARTLASWNLVVCAFTIGSLTSYIFLECQANDKEIKLMVTGNLDNTCKCVNSSFFPVCDEHSKAFISFCHAGCENIQVNNTQGYDNCNQTVVQSNARNVMKGFCTVDCYSNFLKFITVTCTITFLYATSRTSIFWFQTKSDEKQQKALKLSFGMILGFLLSIPAPAVFGYFLDDSCLLWEGCKGNCWLYDNKKLRLHMNMTAIGFAIIGFVFDFGVWCSVENLELFDETNDYIDENDEM